MKAVRHKPRRDVAARRIRADDIVTQPLPLDEAPYAYDIFNRKGDGCVKVVLSP